MSWLAIWSLLQWVIRLGMVPVILGRRFEPAVALAWLALIFFVPELGVVIYLLVGVSYLGKRRARSHLAVVGAARLPERLAEMRTFRERPELLPFHRSMIVQAERISGNPIVGGNEAQLVTGAEQLVERMTIDIDAAEHHVHLLYYIVAPDAVGTPVCDALRRAAARGVQCRLLADASGSRTFLRHALMSELTEAGVQVIAALPVSPWRRKLARLDLRNHRKIAVIDGKIAYTGSHNLVDEASGYRKAGKAGKWIDLSARFRGPVVSQLQMAFLDDWAFETGERLNHSQLFPPQQPTGPVAAQVVPTGPSHEAETFRRVLLAALNVAQEKIVITTPYLVPDEPTTLALAMAADRGVAVTLVVPRRSDHPMVAAAGRWYYEQLLEAGVRIHLYQDGMLHSKTITVDDAFALLGSANIDIRSFYLNFEINVLLYGARIIAQLRDVQNEYMSCCAPVKLSDWRKRPLHQKYFESFAVLFSPVL